MVLLLSVVTESKEKFYPKPFFGFLFEVFRADVLRKLRKVEVAGIAERLLEVQLAVVIETRHLAGADVHFFFTGIGAGVPIGQVLHGGSRCDELKDGARRVGGGKRVVEENAVVFFVVVEVLRDVHGVVCGSADLDEYLAGLIVIDKRGAVAAVEGVVRGGAGVGIYR